MNTSIKQRVCCILLSVLLVVVFIGSLLCALILPFMSSNKVASADYIANNLLYDSDFTKWNLSYTTSAGSFDNFYNHWYTNANANGTSITFSDNVYGEQVVTTTGVRNLFQPMDKSDIVWGARYNFYACINGVELGNVMLMPSSVPNSNFTLEFFQGNQIWLRFTYWANGLNIGSNVIYCAWFISFRTAYTGVLNWVKAERTDNFTGYISREIYNNVYNQGYDAGIDAPNFSQNFVFLDDLNLEPTSGTHYGTLRTKNHFVYEFDFLNDRYHSLGIVPSSSWYMQSYFGIGGLYGAYLSCIGIKYVNSACFGDILITFPFVDTQDDYNLMLVFEDTVSQEKLYVSQRDSVHWFMNGILGQTANYDASRVYDVYSVSVRVHFDNPVNIYFITENPIYVSESTTPSALSSNQFLFWCYRNSYGRIYATQNRPLLGDWQGAYDSGYRAGVDSINVDGVYQNGYNHGYDAGHRDGVLENTDYSFVGLIGAVFDAPIKAFSGLLDFNVLGVNLKSFVLALLSLSVIIIVIKIALGGK